MENPVESKKRALPIVLFGVTEGEVPDALSCAEQLSAASIQVFAVKGTGGLDSAELTARTAAEKGSSCIGVFSDADLADEYASALCAAADVWLFRREQNGGRRIFSVTFESGKAVHTPVNEAVSATWFLVSRYAKPENAAPPEPQASTGQKRAVKRGAILLAVLIGVFGLAALGISGLSFSEPKTFDHEYIDTSPYSPQDGQTDGGLWQSLMDTPTAGDGIDYSDEYYSNKLDGDYVYFPAMGEQYAGCACLMEYLGDEAELILPEKLGGLDVITVSLEAFKDNATLRSVIVPQGYFDISQGAFKGCTALEKIVLPDTVSTIGQSAFSGCTSLTSVNIPDGVEILEGWLFEGCESLKELTIPDSVHTIDNSAFFGCVSLEEIVIPDSVTVMESYAFSGCGSLRRATLGKGITELSASAFCDCGKLAEVIIKGKLSVIGGRAFFGCAFKEFDVPEGVVKIGGNAFGECPELKRISIPTSVEEIDSGAFCACRKLTGIEVSGENRVYSSVDGVLFYNAESRLEQYPAGLPGEYAVPDGTKVIGGSAFANDADLTVVTIPDSVVTIVGGAFAYTALKKVTLPDGVEEIGNAAFAGCEKLKSVEIGAKLRTIGVGAFKECPSLESFRVDEKSASYTVDGGMLVDIKSNTLVAINSSVSGKLSVPEGIVTLGAYCAEGSDISSAVFPASLRTIESHAFEKCEKLRGVTFGGGENMLGYYSFSGCIALESIDIPDSVITMSQNVFSGCTSLADIRLSESLTSIEHDCFENCTALKSIVIPNSVTSLDKAFTGCTSLERVILSDNLEEIGANAFGDCPALRELYFPVGLTFSTGAYSSESLERIYYGGSKRDWQRWMSVTNNYFELYADVEVIYDSQRPEE